MALTTLTVNPQKITVPGNSSDHTINFDAMLPGGDDQGTAYIDNISGPIYINNQGATDAGTLCAAKTTTDKVFLDIKRGTPLHYAGASGGETFHIEISGSN